MVRLFEPQALKVDETISLSERANHHLLTVLRKNVDDEITLFNGEGGEYRCVITRMTKKQAFITVKSYIDQEVESSLKIHLVQAIPKADKLDFIVQKATELGVTSITPIIAARSQGRMSEEQMKKKEARLSSIIIAASEQSGRNKLALLHEIISFEEWLTKTKHEENRFILLPNEKPLEKEISNLNNVFLLIGPEGGFSQDEIAKAKNAKLKPLTLGKRILRTETASLAAIAILQWQFGDFALS